MKKAILATKVGMTQIFADDGSLTPVTVLQAGPCVVTQVKTEENDGYKAVQVGFEPIREKLVNKPQKGAFDKAGVEYKRYAISKGHGFQGAIKKWGQHRGPMKHGSKYHRHAGSNGSSSDPSRVAPGKHMAGRMGREQVTVQNLVVVRVDAEKNLILVKGAVPGPKKSLVTLKETTRTDLK